MWSGRRCTRPDGKESRGPQNFSSCQVDAGVTGVESTAGQEWSPPHESSMQWPEEATPSLPPSQFKPSFLTGSQENLPRSIPLGRRLQTPPSVNPKLSTLFQQRVSTARTVTALPLLYTQAPSSTPSDFSSNSLSCHLCLRPLPCFLFLLTSA